MKLMRKMGIWLGIFLIFSVLVGGCSGEFSEMTTNQYADYKEAEVDGALQRGWLPRNLPASAHGITETHNIDTNQIWVRFQFDRADIKSFLRQCAKAADLRLPSAARTKKMAAWWPEALTDKSGEQLPNTTQAYRCSKMPHAKSKLDAGMVLDTQAQTAWYWVGI